MIAELHIKSQHSRGSSSHTFGGPDTYVAVTITPEGVKLPGCLRRDLLDQRGIQIIYCGEGYREHQGPHSMLGRAIRKAQKLVRDLNSQS